MRVIVQHPRGGAVVLALALAALVVAGRPAAAQGTMIQLDGSVNVGATQTTQATFVADPNSDKEDIPASSVSTLYTELRPGIILQTGSPRLSWRFGYTFSGNISLAGEQVLAYSNQANGALIAELTKFTNLTVTGSAAQGGTSFLLSQQAADMGQPAIRAPGNPNLLSATLGEAVTWAIGRDLALQHSLIGALSAPQDALRDANTALNATLSLEKLFTRDTAGIELHAGISWLTSLQADTGSYTTTTSALLGRWNHDFTYAWNALVLGGVEQVFTDTGSKPLALLPTGSASVRYSANTTAGGLELSHGTTTNLQVGSVAITDRLTARGSVTIDPIKARALSFSAGVLHNQPLGDVAAQVAAGTGNALQADAGFTTSIARNLLATARYSVAYQFGQGSGIGSTLAHIFLIGVTASYSNTNRIVRPLPLRGVRVDGSDSKGPPDADDKGFPVIDEPPKP
jgi:hypothetical protein